MTTIYYDDGGCGSGKTHRALTAITSNGGRHIYAADRIEAIEERARSLRAMRADEQSLKVVTIYSNHDYRAVGPSVTAQIEAVPADYAEHSNIVVLITHEALKFANFEAFAGEGWSLWIDEVPSVLDNDTHLFHVAWDKLDELYSLTPFEDERWSEVSLKNTGIDVAALALCDGSQVLRPFHRRVGDPRRTVLVNVIDWSELSVKRRKMSWYSVWSPAELTTFDAVFMLGNALMNSLTARLWRRHWPEVKWVAMEAPVRVFKPRRVKITYFAESHTATRKLFGSDKGKENLKQIARYLNGRGLGREMIWTCNRPDRAILSAMPGEWLTPKKAGSNGYAKRSHVAAIYTAKPDDSLKLVLERLGLSGQDHTETAEYETILQFICRGSIREPDDQSDFHIYVYDRRQADYLLTYFREHALGYVLWPEIVLENLGFAYDVRDSKRGRKPQVLTLAEQAKRKELRREADRIRKRKARAGMISRGALSTVLNPDASPHP